MDEAAITHGGNQAVHAAERVASFLSSLRFSTWISMMLPLLSSQKIKPFFT